MKKYLGLFLILFAVAAFFAACSGEKEASTEINVTMTDFAFQPMEFTLAAGKEIALTAANNGAVQHEFVIIKKGMEVTTPFDTDDEDKVFWKIALGPGEEETTTFTAPTEPGEYQLVCGTPGHVEAGMVGKIIVK